MKKWIVRLLLLVGFSFPYVYFSMYQDLTNGLMIGYLLMIISLNLLILICKKTHNILVSIPGNIISFITSYLLVNCSTGKKWSYYFKPFTAVGLLKFVSIAMVILQLVVIVIINRGMGNNAET